MVPFIFIILFMAIYLVKLRSFVIVKISHSHLDNYNIITCVGSADTTHTRVFQLCVFSLMDTVKDRMQQMTFPERITFDVVVGKKYRFSKQACSFHGISCHYADRHLLEKVVKNRTFSAAAKRSHSTAPHSACLS